MRATTTLAWGLGVQTAMLLAWMLAFDRKALGGSFQVWRSSLGAGFLGALASQFWFIGFALTSAANVRTLALVEVLMAQAVSHKLFSQATSRREILGMSLIVAGVGLLLAAQGDGGLSLRRAQWYTIALARPAIRSIRKAMSAQAAASEAPTFRQLAARRSRAVVPPARDQQSGLYLRHGRRAATSCCASSDAADDAGAGGDRRGSRQPRRCSTTASSPSSASASIRRRGGGAGRRGNPAGHPLSSGTSTAASAGSTAPSPAEAAGTPASPYPPLLAACSTRPCGSAPSFPFSPTAATGTRSSAAPARPCRRSSRFAGFRAAGAGARAAERVRAGLLPAPDRPLRGARRRGIGLHARGRRQDRRCIHDHGHKRRARLHRRGRGR